MKRRCHSPCGYVARDGVLGRHLAGRRVEHERHEPVREVLVGVDAVERGSLGGVEGQQVADEVARRPGNVRRHRELVANDAHVRLLERCRLERRSTAQQCIPERHVNYIIIIARLGGAANFNYYYYLFNDVNDHDDNDSDWETS